jgi:uncharacterized protein (DUF4213/DUF364 family)
MAPRTAAARTVFRGRDLPSVNDAVPRVGQDGAIHPDGPTPMTSDPARGLASPPAPAAAPAARTARADATSPRAARPRFADALVASIESAFAGIDAPPVAALHLPPTFERGRSDAEFCALELADGSIGLGYALLEGFGDALRTATAAVRPGASSLTLARGYRDAAPLARALGLAAINALSHSAFDRAGYRPPDATDSIGGLDPRPGERIGMVGWFGPLTKRILECGASLVVVELDPRLAGPKDGFEVTLDAGALAGCDKVLSTTTLMLNDTLDAVLDACGGARRVVLVGPSGGCLPDAAFARGVHALGGTAIEDRAGFLRALARGERWGVHARKYMIDAADWAGLPEPSPGGA